MWHVRRGGTRLRGGLPLTDGAVAESCHGLLIRRAIVRGNRLLNAIELDDDGALLQSVLVDGDRFATGEKLAAASGERKAMILFSDGEDNSSAHDLMDAIEAAQSADSVIYTVRYTEEKRGQLPARTRYGIREMERLARETRATPGRSDSGATTL